MALDLSFVAVRLQEMRNLARNSLRESDRAIIDQYQEQLASIAEELLAAVEVELRPDAPSPGRKPDDSEL